MAKPDPDTPARRQRFIDYCAAKGWGRNGERCNYSSPSLTGWIPFRVATVGNRFIGCGGDIRLLAASMCALTLKSKRPLVPALHGRIVFPLKGESRSQRHLIQLSCDCARLTSCIFTQPWLFVQHRVCDKRNIC